MPETARWEVSSPFKDYGQRRYQKARFKKSKIMKIKSPRQRNDLLYSKTQLGTVPEDKR